jgi:hypothetical protein
MSSKARYMKWGVAFEVTLLILALACRRTEHIVGYLRRQLTLIQKSFKKIATYDVNRTYN